MASNLLVL